MPDIGTDFEQGRREEVLTYLTRHYGTERTAHIGTPSLRFTNAALRNTGEVYDDPGIGTRFAAQGPAGGKVVPFAALDDEANPPGAELQTTVADEDAAEGAVFGTARAFDGHVTVEGIHP